MTGQLRALWRLLAVQAAWNYERMQGVGIAWASLPLLAPLAAKDAGRHREAVARSGEFFNANPSLAGVALGAAARAEHDGLPGAQVARLRTALCGPLGALGDQLFWMGLVPGLAAATLALLALGAGWWVAPLLAGVFAAIRLGVGWWALGFGWEHGLRVGGAVQRSWLPKAVELAGRAAAVVAGIAVPLAAWWLLGPVPGSRRLWAIVLALVFFRLASRLRGRAGVVDLTVGVMLLTILWHWSAT
jgi:PTS system mannose-specific IID component